MPLALALISVSNPRLNILDTLSKFSHDADPEVSHNSIFAMGMVGSGKSGYRHCNITVNCVSTVGTVSVFKCKLK